MSVLASIIAATLNAGTPLLIAAIGILVHEKSGVLNLGVEGMMLMGAVSGFAAVIATGSFILGFVAAAIAGILMALCFAFFTQGLYGNQYAAGLALTIFGTGCSALIGQPLQGQGLPSVASTGIPLLQQIPFFGEAFFSGHLLVYAAMLGLVAVWWFLYRSRMGLVIRAVGESPKSAYALGYSVRGIRTWCILFGGMMSGIAGAYISLVYTPLWVEGMVAGRGWIALALVTFATWRPIRVVLGAYLFGGVTMMQFNLQAIGSSIPSQFLSMSPYVATILVLVIISRNAKWIAMNVPASLGKTYRQ